MKLRILACLVLFALLLSGCAAPPYTAVLYNKMNTDVAFTLYTEGRSGQALLAACEDLLDRAELLYSRTDSRSELAAVNADPSETVLLSAELSALLSRALSLAAETDGLFDPTAGILCQLYDITGSNPLPDAAAIAAVFPYTGYRYLTLEAQCLARTPGTVLDLGGIAKGYLAEQLVAYLTGQGVRGGVLSLGGNVAVFGEKNDGSPFRIAIRSPFEGGGTVGVLTLRGTAYISTSGAYERYRVDEQGKRYHHIFDIQTCCPAESDLASVTVVASDGALADAWSTALFVAGYDQAIALWEQAGGAFEMLLVREDGEIYTTPGLSFTPNS